MIIMLAKPPGIAVPPRHADKADGGDNEGSHVSQLYKDSILHLQSNVILTVAASFF